MYRTITLLCMAAIVSAPATAQTQGPPSTGAPLAARALEAATPITLQDALALALANNASLSAARHQVEAASAALDQAGVLRNPEVAVLAEDARRETRTTTWQVNQTIELGGQRAARVRASAYERDIAGSALAAQSADIRAAVVTAFFEVVAAQERVTLATSAYTLAQRSTTAASRRVVAGKISPVEETKAKLAEANVRLELQQANTELALARHRLTALWGNPSPRFISASGEFEALPAAPAWEVIATRIDTAPGIAQADLEVARRGALAQLESRRRIPDVTVSLGVKRTPEQRDQAVVGLSFPLPLFDRNRGNLLEALRKTDKARDELTATRSKVTIELVQAHGQLVAAREAALALQTEILPGARRAYEAASLGFDAGKFNFLDVLDAQRTLLQTHSQYVRTLSEAHRAAAEIERILGSTLPGTQP